MAFFILLNKYLGFCYYLVCKLAYHLLNLNNFVYSSFQNLGIQHVTKKDLVNVLHDKLCQQYQLNLIPQTKPDEELQSFDIAALVDSFGAPDGATAIFDQQMAKILAGL